MKKTLVVIIDPLTPARLGLKTLLERREYGFSVIGTYCDIPLFLDSANNQADIILINPFSIGLSDISDIRKLLSDNESPMIVAMSSTYALPMPLNTFDGILNLYEDEQTIAKQLVAIHERFLSNKNTTYLDRCLTSREKEVLAGLYKGFNTAQIADKLFISVNTVKFHRKTLYSKIKDIHPAECAAFVLNKKLIGYGVVLMVGLLNFVCFSLDRTQNFLI